MKAVVFVVSPDGIRVKKTDDLVEYLQGSATDPGIHFFTVSHAGFSDLKIRSELEIATELWMMNYWDSDRD